MTIYRSPDRASVSPVRAPTDHRFNVLGLPLIRLLFMAFGLASVLLAVLSVQLYDAAWQDAWREVREKHQVMATNLASTVRTYVDDRRSRLAHLADELRAAGVPQSNIPYDQQILLKGFTASGGVRNLYLVSANGDLLFDSAGHALTAATREAIADSEAFHQVLVRRSDYVSGVAPSPTTGAPSVTVGQPVRQRDGSVAAVLMAELSTAPIETLRRQVRFGRGGHAAIVDQAGRVIAHPSEEWRKGMRDLSRLSVVQTMLAGGAGVTQFYSPFVKGDMVAGYAAVPGLGWGVMVPQPEREIAQRVDRLVWRQAAFALITFAGIALLAYVVAAAMTRPDKRRSGSVESTNG